MIIQGIDNMKEWNNNDIQFLIDNYKEMSDAEIAKELGRTECAVATRRKRLGYNKSNRKYTWDDVLKAFSKTDYELISDESDYKDSATNSLRYICPRHREKGVLSIALKHLLDGRGCFYCGRDVTGQKKIKDFEENYYKELCDERNLKYIGCHREKNDNTDSKIYIDFICEKHESFGIQKMLIGNMKRNSRGCPHCKRYRETLIAEYLHENNIDFIKEYKFEDCTDKAELRFDFYLPDCNTIIEYDGEQHYKPIFGEETLELTQKHDQIKNEYCVDNNIRLIRIPYWEQDNLEEYLENELSVNY